MTPISFYTRQIDCHRRGTGGQSAALFLTTLGAILLVVFSAIRLGNFGTAKIASTDSIDSIALSAATWEARCLNLNASLNDGIVQCLNAIRHICIVWATLALAACLGSGMPAFNAYSQRAPKLIRSYWDCAKKMEQWAENVRKTAPFLVLAETTDLERKLNVSGVLVPGNPNGRHDGKNTLELHLKQGPPIYLSDALSPISGIPARLGKSVRGNKLSGGISKSIETALRSIPTGRTPSIRMLEPEEDFAERQNIRYSGFKTVFSPNIPYIGKVGTDRIYSEACSEPYGGSSTEMSWKSRWIDESKKP